MNDDLDLLMNWEDIKLAVNYFIIGAFFGYMWNPIWDIAKKIVSEAKKAHDEWPKK